MFFLHLPWLTHCRKRGTLYTAQATAHRLLQMATNMTVHGTGLFSLLYLNKHSLNKKETKEVHVRDTKILGMIFYGLKK